MVLFVLIGPYSEHRTSNEFSYYFIPSHSLFTSSLLKQKDQNLLKLFVQFSVDSFGSLVNIGKEIKNNMIKLGP